MLLSLRQENFIIISASVPKCWKKTNKKIKDQVVGFEFANKTRMKFYSCYREIRHFAAWSPNAVLACFYSRKSPRRAGNLNETDGREG